MGWLDGENRNFIDAHLYTCGKSEVPEIFHRWACISLIAAATADRVFVTKMGEPLYPNMYTYLIGPSGLGKGEAISAVGRLARRVPATNWLRVKRTAQGLLDKLAARQKDRATGEWVYPNSKLFLVMPELGMAIGSGRIADDFIKHMTDLYTVSDDALDEGTRTAGTHHIPAPCLNWLVGTTKEWLISSITKDALYGGFIARTNCVQADYDLSKRYDEPWFPPDKDEVKAYLIARLKKMTRQAGEVKLSPKARESLRFWYQNREAPDPEDPMTPSWRREHDLILKLCTVLALADDTLTIQPAHFMAAEKLSRGLTARMPDLITYASTTIYTEAIHRAAAIVRRAKAIRQDLLMRRLGITADQFTDVSTTLQMMKLVECDKRKNQFNPTYRWVEKGAAAIVVEDHEDNSIQSGTVSG